LDVIETLLRENVERKTQSACVYLSIFEKQKENSDWQVVDKYSKINPTRLAYFEQVKTWT
jgi:hypothetical protein